VANIFKAKTLVSRTGIFSHEVIAPNLVYNTGDQTISGTKTFIQDTTFGDSAQGDFLVISGNNFTVYGSGNFTSGLFVNGNAVLTGSSTLYATSVNLASTGSTLDNKINNLSGVSVLTFGNQTINGLKTFTSGIDIYSETSPQSLRIFNSTGINSGEFGLIGWRNNQFIIGSQQSQSGILRDVVITGNNININGSGALNIFDNTNIVGNLNVTGNILLSGNQVLTGSSTLYATSANLASTGSTLNTKINNLSGVSVLTFGNQTISGIKTFATGIIVSGNGISTNSLDLNNIDKLLISGLDISMSNSTIVINNSSSAGTRINSSGINLINGDFQLDSTTATNVNSIPLQIAAIQKSAGGTNPINITTFSPHGYRAGDTVIVAGLKTAGCNDSLLNGTYAVNEVTSITSFRYYIPGNSQTQLANLYAVSCGFPPATVTVSSSKVYLSHLNYSGYNNLLINNPPLILSNKININHSRTIASSASTGLRGDISWDSNYLYVCVQDNTWKRFSGFAW